MTVDGGSYTSNGSGSPAVYCTADITMKVLQEMAVTAMQTLQLTNPPLGLSQATVS